MHRTLSRPPWAGCPGGGARWAPPPRRGAPGGPRSALGDRSSLTLRVKDTMPAHPSRRRPHVSPPRWLGSPSQDECLLPPWSGEWGGDPHDHGVPTGFTQMAQGLAGRQRFAAPESLYRTRLVHTRGELGSLVAVRPWGWLDPSRHLRRRSARPPSRHHPEDAATLVLTLGHRVRRRTLDTVVARIDVCLDRSLHPRAPVDLLSDHPQTS